MFGGLDYGDPAIHPMGDSGPVCYSDLWEFTPATDQWTWVGGSSTPDAASVYGTKGIPDPNNTPGARAGSNVWTDSSGNVWLYGGQLITIYETTEYLEDLWQRSATTGQWTWVSGAQAGTYIDGPQTGILGVPADGNDPEGAGVAFWTDSSGNFWLWGPRVVIDPLIEPSSTLWKYTPATGQWTWMGSGLISVSADSVYSVVAIYGTQGVGAATNQSWPLDYPMFWTDKQSHFWLFGGTFRSPKGIPEGDSAILWKYAPP
jgi:hypothetical protein